MANVLPVKRVLSKLVIVVKTIVKLPAVKQKHHSIHAELSATSLLTVSITFVLFLVILVAVLLVRTNLHELVFVEEKVGCSH